jgi:hypothetical protein
VFAALRVVTVFPLPAPASTQVASLPTVNTLFNSAVSDNAFFGSIDLSDFYLGTDPNHPQDVNIFTINSPLHFSPASITFPSLKPTNPFGKAYIVFRIDKTMYGLKEAGKLTNLRLVSLLSSFGFYETSTPCIFKHVSPLYPFRLSR